MFSRQVIGFLLLIAASAFPTFGQSRSTTTGGITGTVRDDADQHTMENVRVDLKTFSGTVLNTAFTGGNGEFEFLGLASGEYIVEVDLKDYEPSRQTVTMLRSSRMTVSVFLARTMAAAKSNSNPSISAHELSVPNKAHDEYEKGLQLFYSKSDYRGAILQFQSAIRDFPTFYEAYAQQGGAYLRLKEFGPGEQALRKSVELSSGQYSDALFMLAGLLNDTNRYPEAATFAQQGIEREPASWHGPYELARSLSGLKLLEDAEKSAGQARDLKPDYAPTYLMLANIHIQRHDYSGLSKDLEVFLKLVPIGPEADQARRTLDDLQSVTQQAANQAGPKAQETPAPAAPHASAPSEETKKQATPDPEADSSGLPSLPPPVQEDY